MQPYRTPNGAPLAGLALVLLLALAVGCAIGIAASLIGQEIYLIFLFPLVMGIAGGTALMWAVGKGRVHGILQGAACGVLMALVIYASYHYTDYFRFRNASRAVVSEQAKQEGLAWNAAVVDEYINYVLTEETGSAGFLGYLRMTAQDGVLISSVVPRADETPLTLSGVLAWGYWLIELSIIAALAAYLAAQRSKQPYCTNCQEWYPGGKYIGSVTGASAASFLSRVKSGSFRLAGEMIEWQGIDDPSLDVYVNRCLECQTCGAILSVRGPVADDKGRVVVKDILEGIISPHDSVDLMSDVTSRKRAARHAEGAESDEDEDESTVDDESEDMEGEGDESAADGESEDMEGDEDESDANGEADDPASA